MCSKNLQAATILVYSETFNFLPLYRRYKKIIFNTQSHILGISDEDLNI
jgi:hypothetical protein